MLSITGAVSPPSRRIGGYSRRRYANMRSSDKPGIPTFAVPARAGQPREEVAALVARAADAAERNVARAPSV
jgi:hypothetical protein